MVEKAKESATSRLKDRHPPNAPPPLFGYCDDDDTLDIVYLDRSFWGWAEINIKPWESLLKYLDEGNKRKKWIERESCMLIGRANPWVV
ncbi:hypothetical protein L2E82_11513 [Cichorium intybus]|uniref:Uncharacterized protein n=1 Tax=Cichorium intybus TaxID=13427 RepID=A0ACB9GFH1_CICIN|nr:hypothetical protein L2E82_11513 [Cichorium intybus]